jgi:hypothetical protein
MKEVGFYPDSAEKEAVQNDWARQKEREGQAEQERKKQKSTDE